MCAYLCVFVSGSMHDAHMCGGQRTLLSVGPSTWFLKMCTPGWLALEPLGDSPVSLSHPKGVLGSQACAAASGQRLHRFWGHGLRLSDLQDRCFVC